MNLFQLIKLLRRADEWEYCFDLFFDISCDRIIHKNLQYYFYVETSCVSLRKNFKEIYTPNPFFWLFIIMPLAKILVRKVKRRQA